MPFLVVDFSISRQTEDIDGYTLLSNIMVHAIVKHISTSVSKCRTYYQP